MTRSTLARRRNGRISLADKARSTNLRPRLDELEDRITPTVAFHPYFGTEATTFGNGMKLNNTPVELIFWGSSYWNNPTGASASTIANAVRMMLSGPTVQHLSQYGAGGSPYLAGWWIDTDDAGPNSTFTDSDLTHEIVNAINDLNSPIAPPGSFNGATPLYMVVTPFGTSVNGSTIPGDTGAAAGYHYDFNASTNYGNYNLIYGWTGQPSNFVNGSNLDTITDIFSHELQEAMTDPQPFSGITCNAGASLPGGGSGEIGDFEPEDYNLDTYRVNGVLEQAMWDDNAQAFTVSDGNNRHLDLYAGYTQNSNGTYNYTGSILDVYGDQSGAGADDLITLDVTPSGGVAVTLNGESFAFGPGTKITQIQVFPEGGSNYISVNNVPANCPVYINGGDGDDHVTVGNSSDGVQGINSLVYISNGSPTPSSIGYSTLTIDDSADRIGREVSMYDDVLGDGMHRGSVLNLAPAPIYWLDNSPGMYTGGVNSLTIDGGSGGNTFSVHGDGNPWAETTLSSGGGNNTVDVYSSSGPLYLDGGSGFQSVDVGMGSTAAINGAVHVENSSSSGHTWLEVDDSSDTTGRTADLYDGELTGLGTGAPIFWTPSASVTGGVTYLAVNGGPGGNTFNVHNTSSLFDGTNLSTGNGSNEVNVDGTTSALNVDGGAGFDWVDVGVGSTAAIKGTVDVYNSSSSGSSYLEVDDSSDTTGRTADLYNGGLTGLGAGAPIDWIPSASATGGVTYVMAYGGSGGNTFNVHNTSNLYHRTYLSTGTGSNTTDIIGTTGALWVTGHGADTLVGPNAASTWNITASDGGSVGKVSFSGVANLNGGPADDTFKFAGGSVTGMVNGGGGSNTLDLSAYSTPVMVDLAAATATGTGEIAGIQTILGGSAANTFLGEDATETWNVTGTNAGNVAGVAFKGFANLTGGKDNDTFKFANGNGVTGMISGGGGTDTLSYTAYTTGVTVNLITGTATGTGGVTGISNVTGGSGNDQVIGDGNGNVINGGGGTDDLVGGGGADVFVIPTTEAAGTTIFDRSTLATIDGPNLANVWTITGGNAGNLNGIAFTGIANLVGGTGTDSFKFGPSGALSGTINGGAGAAVNTLDYSARSTAILVNLATDTATSVQAFSAIGALLGSASAADNLIAANVANTWTLTGSNTGTVGAFGFSGVENLTGGTANDTFKFNPGGGLTGTVNGGGGAVNTLNYLAFGGAVNVNLAASTATGTGGFLGITGLVGSGSSGDSLVGPNTATNTWAITTTNGGTVNAFTFSSVANLTGGTGLDVFKFSNGKNVTGSINGGGGGDWLDYALYTTPVTANLATGAATGVGGTVANIQDVRGGNGGDTLTGDGSGNILIGGTGADTITGGNGASILIGDKGADTVAGGSGNDIIIGGYTNDDASSLANDLALEKILAEWQSGNSFATRVANIKNGLGLTGGNKLVWGSTVHDDLVASVLTGLAGSATNWFFEGNHDTVTDPGTAGQIN